MVICGLLKAFYVALSWCWVWGFISWRAVSLVLMWRRGLWLAPLISCTVHYLESHFGILFFFVATSSSSSFLYCSWLMMYSVCEKHIRIDNLYEPYKLLIRMCFFFLNWYFVCGKPIRIDNPYESYGLLIRMSQYGFFFTKKCLLFSLSKKCLC